MRRANKVIVVGLDGLAPQLVEPMLRAGALPNLSRMASAGGFGSLATTFPAQTPVTWSTFATGVNPGGHGIFDFLTRDPKTYLPRLALHRYEQANAFAPPKPVNLRRGEAIWQRLSNADLPSVVLRCPCTYPPDDVKGRMLAGVGVPDLRGAFGVPTFFSSAAGDEAADNENLVAVQTNGNATIQTRLPGPLHPKTGRPVELPITIDIDANAGAATIAAPGQGEPVRVARGQWSEWLPVKFKLGLLQSLRGMVRFHLVRTAPTLELYASPVNFDPRSPLFPISSPPGYSAELADQVGVYYTTGMVEDYTGLTNGRIDENAFLSQCEAVWREREAMMLYELDRFDEGFFFCLFDTPDRVQHMFWRFREPDHPANGPQTPPGFEHVIEEQIQACDRAVGKALEYADEDTLVIAMSDHGFGSFQRGVNLNTWLHDNGLLALSNGARPGPDVEDSLRAVDWRRTQAFALGLGGIYLNLAGREENGIVQPDEAEGLKQRIAERLTGLDDAERNATAVRRVAPRESVYTGPYTEEAPDLLVGYAHGYRTSWSTAMGGVPGRQVEDNVKRWSGDHTIDPALAPGVLFMNRPFRSERARMTDLAPTIMDALGVPAGSPMEGESLLQ